jgi:hypothetical protein
MKNVSSLPRLAFMMAGLLFAVAQDDEPVSSKCRLFDSIVVALVILSYRERIKFLHLALLVCSIAARL